jgi:hypothetical protein
MVLNVKLITRQELIKKWGFAPAYRPLEFFNDNPIGALYCYIRCNKNGKINWDKAPIYTITELIERNNVKIIQ